MNNSTSIQSSQLHYRGVSDNTSKANVTKCAKLNLRVDIKYVFLELIVRLETCSTGYNRFKVAIRKFKIQNRLFYTII